jgi:hypothetical protein
MMGLDTPETCGGWRNILRISCASSWFFFTRLYWDTRSTKLKKNIPGVWIKFLSLYEYCCRELSLLFVLLSQEYLRNADAYNISTVGCRTAGLYSKSPLFNPKKHRHCKNKVIINTHTQQGDSSCQGCELRLGKARLESRLKYQLSLWFWRFSSVSRQSP